MLHSENTPVVTIDHVRGVWRGEFGEECGRTVLTGTLVSSTTGDVVSILRLPYNNTVIKKERSRTGVYIQPLLRTLGEIVMFSAMTQTVYKYVHTIRYRRTFVGYTY